jgi:hypothetical protein
MPKTESWPSYFLPDGDGFVPTPLSFSPWVADAQNGVALGLLMAHTLERQSQLRREHIARFTLDILRPAPAAHTRIDWRALPAGRLARRLEGGLVAGGVVAARATALLVARGRPGPPAQMLQPAIAPPEEATDRVTSRESGLEVRLIKDAAAVVSGKRLVRTVWVRVRADVSLGDRASPIATAIAAADTGAFSLGEYREGWNFPNLDIAVHFSRAPRGEWVRVDAQTLMLGTGIGVIDHHLADGDGAFARAHQTIFFSRSGRTGT